MHLLRHEHKIKTLCRILRVNRSTYYKHYQNKKAPRIAENQQIRQLILETYAKYRKSLGAYKIQIVLERDYGVRISVGRVYRLMKGMDLPKMSTVKPPAPKKQEETGACHNYLKQQFNPKAPNMVWASDITYLKAGGKWCYLCVILDLFSRKVISWCLSTKIDADLVINTFQQAYASRKVSSGILFHSDRGSQYTSKAFRDLLDSLNVVQSFSKKGYPFDNACCESFFKFLKKERTDRFTYSSQEDLRLELFDYIESFYNNKRPHGSLNYRTPNQAEADFAKQAS